MFRVLPLKAVETAEVVFIFHDESLKLCSKDNICLCNPMKLKKLTKNQTLKEAKTSHTW